MQKKLGTIGNYKDKRKYCFTMTGAHNIFLGAGYRRHHDGGWIRQVKSGRRFHILKGFERDTYELHFDDIGPRNMHKMSNDREMLKCEYGRIVGTLHVNEAILRTSKSSTPSRYAQACAKDHVVASVKKRSLLRTVVVILLAILASSIIGTFIW